MEIPVPVPSNALWRVQTWTPAEFARAEQTKVCPTCSEPMNVFEEDKSYWVTDFGPPLLAHFTTLVCVNGHFQHRAR